jgi:hypothetical protein
MTIHPTFRKILDDWQATSGEKERARANAWCPDCCTPMKQDAHGLYCPDPNCAQHWKIEEPKQCLVGPSTTTPQAATTA